MEEEKSEKIRKRGPYRKAERADFERFIALPIDLRVTEFGFFRLQEFAEKYSLSPDTLTDWQKDESFWKEVKKLHKAWGKEKTPNVLNELYRQAVGDTEGFGRGDIKAIMLWMRYINYIEERQTKKEELTTNN